MYNREFNSLEIAWLLFLLSLLLSLLKKNKVSKMFFCVLIVCKVAHQRRWAFIRSINSWFMHHPGAGGAARSTGIEWESSERSYTSAALVLLYMYIVWFSRYISVGLADVSMRSLYSPLGVVLFLYFFVFLSCCCSYILSCCESYSPSFPRDPYSLRSQSPIQSKGWLGLP